MKSLSTQKGTGREMNRSYGRGVSGGYGGGWASCFIKALKKLGKAVALSRRREPLRRARRGYDTGGRHFSRYLSLGGAVAQGRAKVQG